MPREKNIGSAILKGWMRLHGRLPLPWHRWWGRRIGSFLGKTLRYRRHEVTVNLSRSFPSLDYGQISALSDRFYSHLGKIITEAIWMSANRGDKGRRRLTSSGLVTFTNPGELNRLFEGSPSGAIIMMNHTGNWELIGGVLYFSVPEGGETFEMGPSDIAVTYRRMRSRAWDETLRAGRCAPMEDTPFDAYLESSHVLRYALEHRGERKIYAFIGDQRPYGMTRRTDQVTFMGQQTETMSGAATLAIKLGMPTGYLRFAEKEDGNYDVTVVPLSEPGDGLTVQGVMQKFYSLLEEDIRREPWNYLWTHRRWKQKEQSQQQQQQQ